MNLPSGGSIRGVPGFKTNYMAYINNFYTDGPILDLKVSLDRAN